MTEIPKAEKIDYDRIKNDLTGKVFERLTVICYAGKTKRGHSLWECTCICGSKTIVRGYELSRGGTKSCGCISKKHGQSNKIHRTGAYISWAGMLSRCKDRNHVEYKNYGGRGIQVCDRWKDYRLFYEDMGDKPQGTSLDRIDNDGNYEPGNCRWATFLQQSQNQRVDKGYYWRQDFKKWTVKIRINYKRLYLGSFSNEKEAREAYVTAKKKYHDVTLEM